MTTSTPLQRGRWVKPAVMVAVTLILTVFFTTTLYAGVIGDVIDSLLNIVVGWIADAIAAIIGFFLDGFMAALGTDLSVVLKAIPGLQTFHGIITGISIGLMVLICLIQLFAAFGAGIGIESEHPGYLVGRILFAGLLTIGGANLCNQILTTLSYPYYLLLTEGGLDGSNAGLTNTLKDNLTANTDQGKTINTIIGIILLVIVAWNLIKLVIESVKRYVYCGLLVYLSPLAFSTVASKSTQRIAGSYFSMLVGHGLMMVLNIWCISLVVDAVGAYSSFMSTTFSIDNPAGANITIEPTFFLWTLIILAIIKFGMGLEETLNKVGLHTTGSRQMSGSMLMGAAALMRMLGGNGRRGGGHHGSGSGGGLGSWIGRKADNFYSGSKDRAADKRDEGYSQSVAAGAASLGSSGSSRNVHQKYTPAENSEQTKHMSANGEHGYNSARGQFNDLVNGKSVAGMQNTMNNINNSDKDAISAAKNLNLAAGDHLRQFDGNGGDMDLNKVHGITPSDDGSVSVYAAGKGRGYEGKMVRSDITTNKDYALAHGYTELTTSGSSDSSVRGSAAEGSSANPRGSGTFMKQTTVSADSVLQRAGGGSTNLARKSFQSSEKKSK